MAENTREGQKKLADWDRVRTELAQTSNELMHTVERLVQDGNARTVSLKSSDGKTLVRFSLAVASVLGVGMALVVPLRVIIFGALAALFGRLYLEIEPNEGNGGPYGLMELGEGAEIADQEEDGEQSEPSGNGSGNGRRRRRKEPTE